MNKASLIILSAAALACSNLANASEVDDQIEAAKKAYSAGELRTAVEALNFAVAKIQEQITGGLLKLLPEPLPGWNADEAQAQSGGVAAMITGTTLSRRYVGPENSEVNLSLMADSPLMPMLTMAISMPIMLQSNQDMQTYSFKGNRGMLEHKSGTEDYEITLMVGNRLVVQAKGSQLKDVKPLESYLEALDIDAIQKGLSK